MIAPFIEKQIILELLDLLLSDRAIILIWRFFIELKMIRSERYTSKYLNKGKFDLLQGIDEKVKTLKNQMSLFCKEHIFDLTLDKNFQINYKLFKNDFVTAWQTQTLFQDIIKFYKNAYFRRIYNLDLSIQDGIKIEYYKKNGKHWKKGDLKNELRKRARQ